MRVSDLFFTRCPYSGKVIGLKRPKGLYKIAFFFLGFLSLIWFLIRVIPKPSRASYPCMKATMPLAYSFVAYIIALAGSFLFFKKAYTHIREKRFKYAFVILILAGVFSSFTLIRNASGAKANTIAGPTDKFTDPLGPNNPIGEPKGIIPGRVVWIYNSEATNENCTNGSHSDAYWLDSNCDQDTVDKMFSQGLLAITGKTTHADAWDAVFRYFNSRHEKPDTGYIESETIFVKINAVSAWSGAEPNGDMPDGLGIEFDTSPQSILAMLRQLVNEAGVPQENIYVGDPMCDIWNTLYEKFYAEFPNIKYVSQGNVTGRYKLTADDAPGIIYSDHGTVMTDVTSHTFFNEMMDADYIVNIPSMKGHRWGGVTMFAKNFFGANTADHSWELHKGLMKPDSDPLREGYNLYRVFVDLMSDKDLGGKSLIYFMDALWTTSYEHQGPQKFTTPPFNSDWCSSLLFSLDPVAIESVGLDIMQKEFTVADAGSNPPTYTYVQWNGVDDYLHQAASSDWWPEGIVYDPDVTGTPIGSLGVHEHWNNVDSMQYTRDLGTGEGIELVKIFSNIHEPSVVTNLGIQATAIADNISVYPNPGNNIINIKIVTGINEEIILGVFNSEGKRLMTQVINPASESGAILNVSGWNKGIYYCTLQDSKNNDVLSTAKFIVE
jgi:hypothetical protein